MPLDIRIDIFVAFLYGKENKNVFIKYWITFDGKGKAALIQNKYGMFVKLMIYARN